MQIAFVYPTRGTLSVINSALGQEDQFEYTNFLTIVDVAQHALAVGGTPAYAAFESLFPALRGVERTADGFINVLRNKVVPSEPRGRLSPGAMSNAPDRLDGFHTYNLCCRQSQDTGRIAANLKT